MRSDPSKTLPPDAKACPHEHEEHRFEDDGGPPLPEKDEAAKSQDRSAFLRAMGWKE